MRDQRESTPSEPQNVFSESFLDHLTRCGETSTGSEAELIGPWTVRPVERGFGVFRDWETRSSDKPAGVFEHREHALLTAAVLAATGREPTYHLNPEGRPEGFAVEVVWGDAWTKAVGHVTRFEPAVAEALHVAECIVRSPVALASLIEAAGPSALELAGRILARWMAEEGGRS